MTKELGWSIINFTCKKKTYASCKDLAKTYMDFLKRVRIMTSLKVKGYHYQLEEKEKSQEWDLSMLIRLESMEDYKTYREVTTRMGEDLNIKTGHLSYSINLFKTFKEFTRDLYYDSKKDRYTERESPDSGFDTDDCRSSQTLEESRTENIMQVDGMDTPGSSTPNLPVDGDDLSENQGEEEGEGFDTINTVRTNTSYKNLTNFFNKEDEGHQGSARGNRNHLGIMPNKIAINSINLSDIEKLESQVEPESLRRFLNLKEKYQNRYTAHQQSKIQLDLYNTMKNNPGIQPIINSARSLTESIKTEMDKLEKNMLDLTTSKKNLEFKEPKYGQKATYDARIIGLFPTIGPGSKRRIVTAWNNIANVIEEQNLSMEAGRNLLGTILEGDMIETYELYSHLSGREIAIKLSSMYDTPLNKAKYLDDLHKFRRRSDENIQRAMSRLNTILIGIDQYKRPGERVPDRESQQRHHLREMAGDKIWFEVEREERRSAQDGRILTTDQLAQRCDSKELDILQRKRPEMTINLHTLTIGDDQPKAQNVGKKKFQFQKFENSKDHDP